MVISDSARLLFVHVQKTGGSTIQRALEPALPDARQVTGMDRHSMLGAILREEPDLTSYWTVGFVRNPWARMLSWFRMVERFRETERDGSVVIERKNQFMRGVAESCPDFETFIMKGLDEWTRLQVPQVRYLSTKTRRADMIGRQESLEADLRAVFARCDLPWTPPKSVNVDKARPDYHEQYTEPMRRRVESVFAKDIAVFGYTF